MTQQEQYKLTFYGTKWFSLLPLIMLMVCSITFFVGYHVYDMTVLALGGFSAVIISSLLSKNKVAYWEAAVRGMAGEVANNLTLILIVAGIFSKMMTRGGVASGFVWMGDKLNLSGAAFCVFTFVAACIIATATGTSIGTIITAMAVLYPAGLLLGADHLILVGAILSGALFGDSIGPVSDVTIASCATQNYQKKDGSSDIGGAVSSRIKYSLTAGLITAVLFFIFGGASEPLQGATGTALLSEYSDPKGLLMLIPVALLLIVAIKYRNVYMAITVGILTGTIVALIAGIFPASEIISVRDDAIQGFIIDGIMNMLGTVAFVYSLFAIMGILGECGALDSIISNLSHSRFARTVVGTELLIAIGSIITCVSLGGANGPTCLMFGPITDELGKRRQLHPYRRANLLAGFSSTLPVMIPFTSLFIFITSSTIGSIADEYEFVQTINPIDLPKSMFFCMAFAAVWLFSIITGWGREYEGQDGAPVRKVETVDSFTDDESKHAAQ